MNEAKKAARIKDLEEEIMCIQKLLYGKEVMKEELQERRKTSVKIVIVRLEKAKKELTDG